MGWWGIKFFWFLRPDDLTETYKDWDYNATECEEPTTTEIIAEKDHTTRFPLHATPLRSHAYCSVYQLTSIAVTKYQLHQYRSVGTSGYLPTQIRLSLNFSGMEGRFFKQHVPTASIDNRATLQEV